MGEYTAERGGLTCNNDHNYSQCPAEHHVSASYSRSSDTITLEVDRKDIVMDLPLFLQLQVCVAEMLANGSL